MVYASVPVGEFGGKVRPPLATGLFIWRPHTILPQTEESEIFHLFLFIQTHLVVP